MRLPKHLTAKLVVAVAGFSLAEAALARCYWQWQGFRSRWVCESNDTSFLPVISEISATIKNPTNAKLNYAVQCNGGAWSYHVLPASRQYGHSCTTSNTSASPSMRVSFDGHFADGMQTKTYNIGTSAGQTLHFAINGQSLDLFLGDPPTPSVIIPTLKPQTVFDCSAERPSPGGQQQLSSLSINNASGAPYHLYWINGSGQRIYYATIQPGQTHVQSSYARHWWVVTSANGTCYRALRAPERGYSSEGEDETQEI